MENLKKKKRRRIPNIEMHSGTVNLPKKTKSGRAVITPSHYQNNKDEQDDIVQNEDIGIEMKESSFEFTPITEKLQVYTGEDLMRETNTLNTKSDVNLSERATCQYCNKNAKINNDCERNVPLHVTELKMKLKAEIKKRRHLEKLLEISMQRQKASELKAQVADEILKAYCPMDVITGSSPLEYLTSSKGKPKFQKKSQKGKWSWKKSAINTKKKKLFVNTTSTKRVKKLPYHIKTDDLSVELIEPESPLGAGNDTTVILVGDGSDAPIVSYSKDNPAIDNALSSDDELPSNIEDFKLDSSKQLSLKNGYYHCNDCPFQSLFKTDFMQHLKKHRKIRKFACSKCPFSCSLKTTLTSHMSTHNQLNNKSKKNFKCSQCNYQTAEKSLIVEHERSHFEERFRNKSMSKGSDIINVKREVETPTIIHSCDKCEFTANTKSEVTAHSTFNCPNNS